MIFLILLLFTLPHDQRIYSGKCHVEGLGDVAFPEGHWILEHRSRPDKEQGTLDTYVFKRKGQRLERLSFEKFPPDRALPTGCYFDSVGDSMSCGIPIRLLQFQSEHDAVEVLVPLNDWQTDNGKVTCQGSSFIYTSEDKPSWMGHAFSCSVDGWVVVACHSSPDILSLEQSKEIYFESQFQLNQGKVPKSDDRAR